MAENQLQQVKRLLDEHRLQSARETLLGMSNPVAKAWAETVASLQRVSRRARFLLVLLVLFVVGTVAFTAFREYRVVYVIKSAGDWRISDIVNSANSKRTVMLEVQSLDLLEGRRPHLVIECEILERKVYVSDLVSYIPLDEPYPIRIGFDGLGLNTTVADSTIDRLVIGRDEKFIRELAQHRLFQVEFTAARLGLVVLNFDVHDLDAAFWRNPGISVTCGF